ncbi:hypothetical protein KY285_001116 [Solanum tuberosum]|nr:hypothetical protein KY285_001116 [Solanum tuberosum]
MGWHFTWCNKQGGNKRLQHFGHIEAEYLNPSISDHSPILIKCKQYNNKHPRPFRFFNNMMEHPDFTERLRNAWGDSVEENTMKQISKINQELIDQEKQTIIELEKWSNIEEAALRQKARANWIELGDSNSKYFHD